MTARPSSLPSCCETWQRTAVRASARADRAEHENRQIRAALETLRAVLVDGGPLAPADAPDPEPDLFSTLETNQ